MCIAAPTLCSPGRPLAGHSWILIFCIQRPLFTSRFAIPSFPTSAHLSADRCHDWAASEHVFVASVTVYTRQHVVWQCAASKIHKQHYSLSLLFSFAPPSFFHRLLQNHCHQYPSVNVFLCIGSIFHRGHICFANVATPPCYNNQNMSGFHVKTAAVKR